MKKDKYVAYVGTYTHGSSIGIHLYDLDVEDVYKRQARGDAIQRWGCFGIYSPGDRSAHQCGLKISRWKKSRYDDGILFPPGSFPLFYSR